jgi:Domain of unknown function (DUF5655)
VAVPQSSLWTCPDCGHKFVTRNLSHSCGRFLIADHFQGKDPNLRRTFRRLVSRTRRLGPLTVYAQKTRIVFMVRVRFASVVVRKRSLDFALWLTRRIDHPRRRRVEVLGRRIFYTHFSLASPEDIDSELESLVSEAYRTGRQVDRPGLLRTAA